MSFRDTFNLLVNENNTIGKIERFHYLVSCLSGPAYNVVKAIPLSGANYDIAWSALSGQYENKRLLATAHLEKIFAFRTITLESVFSLTNFVNVFQENIAAISVLGVEDLAGFLLLYIGSRVLDTNTKQLFESRIQPSTIPTFNDLLAFVQQRRRILENVKGPCKMDLTR